MSNLECEIVNVPYEEDGGDDNELVITPPIKKPRKPRVMTEETKEKLRKSLAKARAVRAANKLEHERELEKVTTQELSRRASRAVESDEESPPESPVLSKRYKKPGNKPKPGTKHVSKSHKSRKYYSESEDSDSGSESEEEYHKPKKPSKRTTKTVKVKTVSEKEKRLLLLESKLDQIIMHTRKNQAAPKVKNIKTTNIMMPKPEPVKMSKEEANMAKKAAALMNFF